MKIWQLSPALALLALGFVMAGGTTTDATAAPDTNGVPPWQSVGALELGPNRVLFVGDNKSSAVYALELGKAKSPEPEAPATVEDLDEKMASLLGVGVRDVAIQDMVADPSTGTTYFSVMRGRDDGALPVVLSLAPGGELSEVSLESTPYSRLEIPKPPAADAKLYRWDSRTFTITDLEFIDGELFIAGLSNEEFASTLRRAHYPFTGDVEITRLEIYHGAHGEYETFAPIFSFIPYQIAGKTHLLAGYLCTPLVTFPLDQIRSQKKLRGKTIAELGAGNIPTDIVAYERRGEEFVLVVNNRRGVMRISRDDIEAAQNREGISEPAGPRTGVTDETVPLGHVAQVADFDADHLLVLARAMDTGSLYLQSVRKARV